MSLVRHTPVTTLHELQDKLDKLFNLNFNHGEHDSTNAVTSNWSPRVDIEETPDNFVLTADLPGIEPNAIKIKMDGDNLVISGERHFENKENKENFFKIERSYGSFHRKFSLPSNVDRSAISAHGKNGVLEVIVPKIEQSRAQDIKVENRN